MSLAFNLETHRTFVGNYGEKDNIALYHPFALMNVIGANVALVARRKNILAKNILVLHDELELGTGVCKFRGKL